MGFSVFQHGVSPSVERLLADHYFQRLLYSLLAEHLFLAAGQARQFLLQSAPADTPPDLVCEDYVRKNLDRLVHAGYLGAASTLLPPVTISEEPLLVLRGNVWRPLTVQEVTPLATRATERVPGIAFHKLRRLYYAKDALCPCLRSLGFTVPRWETDADWHGREDQFETIFESHTEVLDQPGHTAYDIARTLLTAHFNVNSLRFTDRFRSAIATGACEFRAEDYVATNHPEARVRGTEFKDIALYFARPLTPHLMREQVGDYREHHMTRHDGAWWM